MYVINKNNSFQDVTESYREAPYYTLDKYVIPGYQEKEESCTSSNISSTPETEKILPEDIPTTKIPLKKYPRKTKVSSCREIMQEIKSLTFITNDEEASDALEEGLLDLKNLLLDSSLIDEGFVVEDVKAKKRYLPKEDKTFQNLPMPRKRTIAGRVGIDADSC